MEIIEWEFIYILLNLIIGTATKNATFGPWKESNLRFLK
jgi:hypothetical protein